MRPFVAPAPKLPSILANTNQLPWKDSRDRSVADVADARVERSRLTHLCLPEDRVANQYRDRLCCFLAEFKSRAQSSALRQSDDREEEYKPRFAMTFDASQVT